MPDVRLVTVHSGSLWEVELLAGLLEGAGIPTFLPDHLTKRVDPFITGANPLTARLQVRAEDAERAAALLESERSGRTEETAEEVSDGAGPEPPLPEDGDDDAMSPEEELRYLASRTRWWALISCVLGFLTLPFALLYFITYLRAVREYGRRAPGHTLTVAAPLLVTAAAVAFLFVIVRLIAMDGP